MLLPLLTFGRIGIDRGQGGGKAFTRMPNGTILLDPEIAAILGLLLLVALFLGGFVLITIWR